MVLITSYRFGYSDSKQAHSLIAAGFQQKSSDPLTALVPVLIGGATCVVAKLCHKQKKTQRDLKHKQGLPYSWPELPWYVAHAIIH